MMITHVDFNLVIKDCHLPSHFSLTEVIYFSNKVLFIQKMAFFVMQRQQNTFDIFFGRKATLVPCNFVIKFYTVVMNDYMMNPLEELDDEILYAKGDSESSESDSELETLPQTSPVTNSEESCPICIIPVKEDGITTPCGHTYHHECLKNMLMDHGTDCCLCRQDISFNWLHQHEMVTRVSPRIYWRRVRYGFGRWPIIGPFVPCQQRYYDQYADGRHMPTPWSRQWTEDRKAELRMRLNIPPSVLFTNNLLIRCMERGRHGLKEWIPRMSP